MGGILARPAFYAGRPNAWMAFRMAAEACAGGGGEARGRFPGRGGFKHGFCPVFYRGRCLKILTGPKETVFTANVIFGPGCRSSQEAKRPGDPAFGSPGFRHLAMRPWLCLRCIRSAGWTAGAGQYRRQSAPYRPGYPPVPPQSPPGRG